MTPFAGADGNPMTDVSGFGDVLDHIGELGPLTPYDILFTRFSDHQLS